MEGSLWEAYRDRGLMVLAIAPNDPQPTVETYVEQMGLTFPVLMDIGGVVHGDYSQSANFANTIYPQDWIIGSDGTVKYSNNAYEPDEMIAIIEAELAAAGL